MVERMGQMNAAMRLANGLDVQVLNAVMHLASVKACQRDDIAHLKLWLSNMPAFLLELAPVELLMRSEVGLTLDAVSGHISAHTDICKSAQQLLTQQIIIAGRHLLPSIDTPTGWHKSIEWWRSRTVRDFQTAASLMDALAEETLDWKRRVEWNRQVMEDKLRAEFAAIRRLDLNDKGDEAWTQPLAKAEVAELYGICVKTLGRWMDDGKIRFCDAEKRTIRIPLAEYERLKPTHNGHQPDISGLMRTR